MCNYTYPNISDAIDRLKQETKGINENAITKKLNESGYDSEQVAKTFKEKADCRNTTLGGPPPNSKKPRNKKKKR